MEVESAPVAAAAVEQHPAADSSAQQQPPPVVAEADKRRSDEADQPASKRLKGDEPEWTRLEIPYQWAVILCKPRNCISCERRRDS